MQNVYVVWDIEYDENNHYAGKLIDGIYDSEEKAIQGIQRTVKWVHRLYEKLGGHASHVTYLIDHVPTADEILRDNEITYQAIDNCKQALAYDVYCMM